MNPIAFMLMSSLLATSVAVTAQEPVPLPQDQIRAQAAMADLGQRLKSALVARMQAQGPLAAVDFCHVQAPLIAAEVTAEHGIAVGRTALRLRNPANAPTAWQEATLTRFLREAEAGAPAGGLLHVERDEESLRLARGIATEGPCQICHGSNIAEPIRAAIIARYPEDAATGFSEGDLRGLIWAEVSTPQEAAAPMPSRP